MGNKWTKACRPLQMQENVTWRHTTRSSRIRHREITSRRDQRKAQVEEAELQISRFVLLVGLKVTEQQGALFDNPLETAISKGKSIPAKRAPPSPQHKAASIVMPAEETSEWKHCRLEQIEEFRRDGQIPVRNGSFLPLTSLVLPDKEKVNVPVCEGHVGHLSECCETRDAAVLWSKRILSRRKTS